jgi:bacterioferritin-associated ferredoxin
MYVCICNGITVNVVREAAQRGCTEPEELAAELGLDSEESCGRCLSDVDRICSYAQRVRTAVK